MKSKQKNIIIIVLSLIVILGGVFVASELSNRTPVEFHSEVIDKYMELYNGEKPSIVYIAQTGCGACEAFTPVMEEVATKKKLDYYYIDLVTLSRKESQKLYATSEAFSDPQFGTPTLIIVGGGKSIVYNIGYLEKADLISFLKTAGIK